MNRVAFHFASGDAFFWGTGLVVGAAILSAFFRRRTGGVVVRLLVGVGTVLIALSSTPLPLWFYVLWAAPVLWLFLRRRPEAAAEKPCFYLPPLLVTAVSLTAAAWEAPFHLKPSLRAGEAGRIVVIGDSITAGVGDDVATWPVLLEGRGNVEIIDLSQAGMATAGAVRTVESMPAAAFADCVVIIEIGGNDMLARMRDVREFESALDRLFALVSRPTNTVILLELPLPPFHNKFGRVQRKLAGKYNALLVPKRCFLKIIAHPDATQDGLHLSQAGQEMMAEMLWEIVAGKRPGQ